MGEHSSRRAACCMRRNGRAQRRACILSSMHSPSDTLRPSQGKLLYFDQCQELSNSRGREWRDGSIPLKNFNEMFPRPVIRENRSRTLLRIETVANTLPSKSHVRPPWIKGKARERERKRRRRKRIHTHRSRITILGVLLDRSIDIGSSFHREASREKKKFFSPYLMIYFSSHFTNDKRLWNGGERS